MLGEQINVLLKCIKLFGLKDLTDYDNKIFNYKLKHSCGQTLIEQLNELKTDIELVFNMKVEVNDVDQAVKLLKKLLDQCNINYRAGRTSKSSYLSLIKPQSPSSHKQKLIGNYVFNIYEQNNSIGLFQLIANDDLFSPDYSLHFNYIRPSNTGGKVVIERRNCGDCHYYILIIFNLKNPSLEVSSCVESISGGFVNYELDQKWIDNGCVYCLYKANIIYTYSQLDQNIVLKLNDQLYEKYGIIDMSLVGTEIFYETKIRKNGLFNELKKADQKSITDVINITDDYYRLQIDNNYISNVYINQCPEKIIIHMSGLSQTYDKNIVNFIKRATNSEKFCVPFYLSEVGINCVPGCRIDSFYIEFFFDRKVSVTFEVETLNEYLNDNSKINQIAKKYFPNNKKVKSLSYQTRDFHQIISLTENNKCEIPIPFHNIYNVNLINHEGIVYRVITYKRYVVDDDSDCQLDSYRINPDRILLLGGPNNLILIHSQ